jgi:hypothetical protein
MWLVAGLPRRKSGFCPRQSMWELWWIKWHLGFSPNASVQPCQDHSNNAPYSQIMRTASMLDDISNLQRR